MQKIKRLDEARHSLKAEGHTLTPWRDVDPNSEKQLALQFVEPGKRPSGKVDSSDQMRINSCCGPKINKAEKDRRYIKHMITGSYHFGDHFFPQVGSQLSAKDKWASFGARLGYKRDDYEIEPGLYALGEPNDKSHVVVTANYKMSFDALRHELSGYDIWILVLDTFGINVWCAAGKGTFGTKELVSRIKRTGLHGVVNHRNLILPQLGGPGIAGHSVKKESGFSVIYGPVRASDLPQFLERNFVATEEMRQVTFTLKERLVLAPLELIQLLKPFSLILFLVGLSKLFGVVTSLFDFVLPFLGAALVGTLCVPICLPLLPGRAFSIKGLVAGLIYSLLVIYLAKWTSMILMASYVLLLTSIITFSALNFTGASTYTSFSGVKAEMEVAIPAMMTATGLGVVLLLVHVLQQF